MVTLPHHINYHNVSPLQRTHAENTHHGAEEQRAKRSPTARHAGAIAGRSVAVAVRNLGHWASAHPLP